MMNVAMDEQWIRSLERLAAANAREHRERLRRFTKEESIREFEALCEELEREYPDVLPNRDHYVGLIKYWNRS